ncbi:MAG TPA: amidohydrolase [Balneolaceae bacterium]|nr:amidohydrolase [Balneolaceae bacterium]
MKRPTTTLRLSLIVIIMIVCWQPAVAQNSNQPTLNTSSPDLILLDGKIFTADTTKPWAQAVAIKDDKIEAVCRDDSVRQLAGSDTKIIDLKGHVLVPGLTDAHVHPVPDDGSVSVIFDKKVGRDPTKKELKEALLIAIRKASPGQVIEGNFGSSILDDTTINRSWLDHYVPNNPLFLWHFSGHGMIVNTAALRFAGISPEADNPPGGWYGRVHGSQKLNGRIYEYGIWDIEKAILAKLPFDTLASGYHHFAENMAAWGVTTVQTMGTDVPIARLIATLDASHPTIRFSIYERYLPKKDVAEEWEKPQPVPNSPKVRIAGMKWILDGTPPDRNAFMRRPYADRPGWRGRLDFSPEDLRRILKHAFDNNEQVALHTVGDSTASVVFHLMKSIAPVKEWRSKRIVRIEHGDGLAPDLLKEGKKLGIILTQNPLHFTQPKTLLARYGASRMEWLQPLESALDAEIPLALGSDQSTGPPLNPWLNLMLAVRDPAHPQEGLTREQALLAYTKGGAYAEREENIRGKIAPGMLADLAVLSDNPFTISLNQMPRIKSVLTLVGGNVIYDAGMLSEESSPQLSGH